MVAIPLVDTNKALPHERGCPLRANGQAGRLLEARTPLDTEKLPPMQGKLPKRCVFSPCYRRTGYKDRVAA